MMRIRSANGPYELVHAGVTPGARPPAAKGGRVAITRPLPASSPDDHGLAHIGPTSGITRRTSTRCHLGTPP